MNVIYVDELFFLNALTDYLLLLSCARLRGRCVFAHTLCRGRGARRGVRRVCPRSPALVSRLARGEGARFRCSWRGSRSARRRSSGAAGAAFSRSPRRSPGRCTAYRCSPARRCAACSPALRSKTLTLSLRAVLCRGAALFGRFLKRRERCVVEAKIELCAKTVSLRALRDTGNSLFRSALRLAHPARGAGRSLSLFTPPLVLPLPDDPAACFRVLSSHPVRSRRLRLVGFSAVGTKRGRSCAFRPDAVTVEGIAEQYLVALSPTPLGGGEYSALV